jgi:hypothetical protein
MRPVPPIELVLEKMRRNMLRMEKRDHNSYPG